jgi:ubiquinone/menaquinone biosynthesis C-methylase UbiE
MCSWLLRKVGPTGRAIGIDMTPEMVERARRNAEQGNNGKPFTNVEFHLAKIDNLPLADNSVDCVINCVIQSGLGQNSSLSGDCKGAEAGRSCSCQ